MTSATIFIPDISGFTEFLTRTEIKHSSHIINELLEGITRSNSLGFHLSEVEGDAVLFYKKGEPVPRQDLVRQCAEMYRHFHYQLKGIERDSICRCGACTTASSLTLKFVVHYGDIREITVSNFLKATGADMIVAHRLMKNAIGDREYVLLSRRYCEHAPVTRDRAEVPGLRWQKGREEYASIGAVDYEFACLDVLLDSVPEPPPLTIEEPPLPAANAQEIVVDIDVPMAVAYQNLIDTDKRSVWVTGMTKLEHQPVTERAGMQHYCLTQGVGLDHVIVGAAFHDKEIRFVEEVIVRGWRLKVWDHYKVADLGGNRSRLSLRFAFRKPNCITRLVERVVLRSVAKDFRAFKAMCEKELATAAA